MDAVDQLQSESLSCLGRHLRPGGNVALLDFPRHQNAGDSLIWQGERAYLSRMGVQVRYSSDLHCFSASGLRRAMPDGTILITGGGNFGDRWREHHAHRLDVLSAFPDYPIVQLPQSLDFSSDASAESTCRVVRSHRSFTMLVREREAAQRAKLLFPSTAIEFCPDMALGAGLLPRLAAPDVSVVFLLRQDSEGIDRRFDVPRGLSHRVTDWALQGPQVLRYDMLRLPENVARVLPILERSLRPTISRTLESISALNVTAARRILAQGELVVTDRLHAMVLAALSSIPVVALDNANGKVRAIFHDYVGDLPGTYLAEDASHAIGIVEGLLDQRTR